MLKDLDQATERESEFQAVLTLLLNECIVALLIHLSLRILIRGQRLLVE